MTKKAKARLENKLRAQVKEKYHDDIIDVKVVDKTSCKLTIELEWTKQYVDVLVPIAALC